MKFRIFSIFDGKAKAYMTPFFLPEKGQAIRAFMDEVNSDSVCGKHPEDFTLFCIGSFDSSSGQVEYMSSHEVLGNGIQFKRMGLSGRDMELPLGEQGEVRLGSNGGGVV